ncbi:MAG: hypothetical protein EOO08_07415 [Chitinophagaceae bacterium]|nr:MAG: hypothetical protein EOO08_07415 [Chitinophagaceae bacterium]
MPDEILPDSNSNEPQPRRHRRSHGSSRSSGRSRSHRKSSASSASDNTFTLGQFLLLLWSAATLGILLYLIGDVHRAPLPAILGLAGAALLGLLLFFRGLRKKKRK